METRPLPVRALLVVTTRHRIDQQVVHLHAMALLVVLPSPEDRQDFVRFQLVPGQILIAFVAKLKLYGFWRGEGRFAELLRILEKDGATGLGGWQRAVRIVGIGGPVGWA